MYSALPGEEATIEVSDQLLSSAAGASGGLPGASSRKGDGLRGGIAMKYAPEQYRPGLASAQQELGDYTTMRMCAGFDYADLVTGEVDYLMFSRVLPWDHAPGARSRARPAAPWGGSTDPTTCRVCRECRCSRHAPTSTRTSGRCSRGTSRYRPDARRALRVGRGWRPASVGRERERRAPW